MNPERGALLRDELERVIANPTAGQLWHRLLAAYETNADAHSKVHARQCLIDKVPAAGITGFFLATFLAWVTGDTAYNVDAGRILQDIRPIDPERLMAFAAFEWGRALTKNGDRGDFTTSLQQVRLPETMHLAGTYLSQNAACAMPVRDVDRVSRVALVTPFLGLQGHAPTVLALHHARLLQGLGLQVHVLCAQELLLPDMPDYLGNKGRILVAEPDVDVLATRIPSGVTVSLGDAQCSLMRRWRGLLSEVAAFDPDLILFVGLNSPLVTPLYQVRPVLGLCVHSTVPMAPVDIWLTATPSLAGRYSAPWAPALPPAWGHYHPYRIALEPPDPPIARAQMGLAEQDIVLVTIGARLDAEIAGEWAASMADLLARSPRLVWMLAGGAGTVPPALRDVPADRLRVVRHSDHIRGILRCCDIYVNPPRLGGGFSVAEAMAEGLPVIAFANSDGGNKLGALALETAEAYFSELKALVDQPALRERTGSALRELFWRTLDLGRSGPSLLSACEQTISLFQKRTKVGEARRFPKPPPFI